MHTNWEKKTLREALWRRTWGGGGLLDKKLNRGHQCALATWNANTNLRNPQKRGGQ